MALPIIELERIVCNLKPAEETIKQFQEKRRKAAEKLFGVPELLKRILLSGITIRELLGVIQVNKTFYTAISGSLKLLRYMGLVADSSLPYRSGLSGRSGGIRG